MRIRITKALISVYGPMVPGMEVTVPDHTALNWIKNGIAMPLEEPKNIPAGMFWCGKHQTLHKLDSRPGKRCLKRIEKEKEEAAAKAKEAEAKAKDEAEAAAEEARKAEENAQEAKSLAENK